jgi:hypothetical protein
MNTIVIKEKLHSYIDKGDEKLLKLLFALAKEYADEDDSYEFTEDELKVLEQRRNDRLSGKSKVYSWEDAKKAILNSGNIAM